MSLGLSVPTLGHQETLPESYKGRSNSAEYPISFIMHIHTYRPHTHTHTHTHTHIRGWGWGRKQGAGDKGEEGDRVCMVMVPLGSKIRWQVLMI